MSLSIPFRCTVCSQGFDEDSRYPVVMPCGHTYICHACAKNMNHCPECQRSLLMDGQGEMLERRLELPKNTTLLSLVDACRPAVLSSSKLCGGSYSIGTYMAELTLTPTRVFSDDECRRVSDEIVCGGRSKLDTNDASTKWWKFFSNLKPSRETRLVAIAVAIHLIGCCACTSLGVAIGEWKEQQQQQTIAKIEWRV